MNAKNRQRYIIIAASILALLLIIALIFFGINRLRNRGPSGGGTAEDIVAAPPTATATPFPTLTPTPTNTPIPTETPLPSPTPLPDPMVFSISGPKFVPVGLPRQVDWTIETIDGDGAATIILDDLGGAMLTGDESGNVVIARTVSNSVSDESIVKYPDRYVISAIIDPNVKSGVISFELRNQLFSEPVLIPWIAVENPDETYQSFEITLDGVEEEVQVTNLTPVEEENEAGDTSEVAEGESATENGDSTNESEESSEGDTTETETDSGDGETDPLLENTDETVAEESGESQPGQGGFQTFVSQNGISLDFPADWYITESQDGIIDISIVPIDPEAISVPGEDIFVTIFTGPAEDYGISSGQEVTPDAIKELLLGKVIPSGSGSDAILLTETGLQLNGDKTFNMPDGYSGKATRLKTPEGFDESGDIVFESIFAVVTKDKQVIVLNGYTLSDKPELLNSMELIASSLRFIDEE